MHHPHPIIAALVLVTIMVAVALTLLQAIRNGEFGSRGRTYIVRRRKQPVQFWMSIVAGSAFLIAGAGLLARMFWQALSLP
jgi:hypothetical protein